MDGNEIIDLKETEPLIKKSTNFMTWAYVHWKTKAITHYLDFIEKCEHYNYTYGKFVFTYRDIDFSFLLNHEFLEMKVLNTRVLHFNFTDKQKILINSLYDIYKIINSLSNKLIVEIGEDEGFKNTLKKRLQIEKLIKIFWKRPDTLILLNILNFDKEAFFLKAKVEKNSNIYRIRKNADSSSIMKVSQCMAAPKQFVDYRGRFNEIKESVFYGCLHSSNLCFPETNVKIGETYILVEANNKRILNVVNLFGKDEIKYLLCKDRKFTDCYINLIKLSFIERVSMTKLIDFKDIYLYTIMIRDYIKKIVPDIDGICYYSTYTIMAYDLALFTDQNLKVVNLYECKEYSPYNSLYRQIMPKRKAIIEHDMIIRWIPYDEPFIHANLSLPMCHKGLNKLMENYLGLSLREKEIENNNPLEFDDYGFNLNNKNRKKILEKAMSSSRNEKKRRNRFFF